MTLLRIVAVTALSLAGLFMSRPCYAQEYHWRRAYLPQNNTDPWSAIAFNPLAHGRVLFAGPHFVGGVFRSDDGGMTWIEHDSLLDPIGLPIDDVHQVFCVPSDTNVVLAVTLSDFYRSTDGGLTWNDLYNYDDSLQRDTLGGQNENFGGTDGESVCYNAEENALYYGQNYGAGVWRSVDGGANWTLLGPTSDSIEFDAMDVSQDHPPLLIQATFADGNLAHSSDLGTSWTVTFTRDGAIETPKIVFSWQAVNPTTGMRSIAIAQRWPTTDSSFLATTDGGATWQTLLNAPPRTWGLDIDQRATMLSKPSDPAYPLPLHFFTGFFDVRSDTVANGMVQETTDGGIFWHSIGFPKGVAGDTANPVVKAVWVVKFDTSSGRIAVATDSGIYIGDLANGRVEEQQPAPLSIQFTQDADFVTLTSEMPIESIHLFDMAGRQILESEPKQNAFRLATTLFSPGIYAIVAFIQGQPPFRKLINW